MRTKFAVGPDGARSMIGDAKAQRGINALDSTGEILLALIATGRPLSLRDLAAAAGMPPAKAFPHLVSLQKIGLLNRDASGCFDAGPLGMELGLIALQRLSPTRDAEPEIAALAGATGMTVAAATLGPLGPTVIRLEESTQPQHVSLREGTVMSLINTAIGRVFAAHVSEDVLTGLLPQETIRLAGSQSAKAPPAGFRKRLADIRESGIDHAIDAPVPGISTLAAPVFDHTGSIRLAIALIGPSGTFDHSSNGEIAQRLLAATGRLSWRFGWISNG